MTSAFSNYPYDFSHYTTGRKRWDNKQDLPTEVLRTILLQQCKIKTKLIHNNDKTLTLFDQ